MPGPADVGPDMPGSGSVTVVVPTYNSAARLDELTARLDDLVVRQPRVTDVILVDDASSDGTWEAIVGLAATRPFLTGLRLAENVGQVGALCAGFLASTGSVVVMMDDDLESDPVDAVQFIAAVDAGATFASGARRGQRTGGRMLASLVYNARLRRLGFRFDDAGCGFNGMTGELAHQMGALGWEIRQHRFKPTVATMTTAIVEIPVDVRPTEGSNHHILHLAASWLDVELTFGTITVGRYVTATIIAPTLAALSIARAGRATPNTLRALGVFAVTTAGAAATVLRLRSVTEARSRSQPSFVVAATTAT